MSLLERISCSDFTVIGGYAYFSNVFYNGFFKTEINTGKTFFLGNFKDEKLFELKIHVGLFQKNGKIYFCPRRGRCVHVYDLSKQSMQSIIVKETSELFAFNKVILSEQYAFLIPRKKIYSIKKLDLDSLKIENVNNKSEVEGIELNESKPQFPETELIKKYHIEYAEFLFWNRLYAGIWYGFSPAGHYLLQYVESTHKLEMIPLVVQNKEELEYYLSEVRKDFLEREIVYERKAYFREYLEIIKAEKTSENNYSVFNYDTGDCIWKHMISSAAMN